MYEIKELEYYNGYKVRDLAKLFSEEEGYRDYTLDQFKEWLNKAAPEEDWTDINIWGNLQNFDCISLNNKDIFDYLFQLGVNPSFIYSNHFNKIKRLEIKMKDPKYMNSDINIIQESKEIVSVCERYMSEEDKELSLYSHELSTKC